MLSIKNVCVCGAGTMGSGIAQVAAQNGYNVIQYDLSKDMLDKSKAAILKSLEYLVSKNKITQAEADNILSSIIFTNKIEDCKADLVIEAIVEKIEIKKNLFNQLAALNTDNCLLTSNTSSISVNDIASDLLNPERFAGLHFFNPATIMKLVEIIKTDNTSGETVEALKAFCSSLNKVAVVCSDSPGFIVNRVARPYYLEAMKLVEDGKATIETVDEIMEASGFKMGPFKLMDLIGIDINYGVSNIVWNDLGKPERLTPSILQKNKIDEGELGRKTGKGFYEYS